MTPSVDSDPKVGESEIEAAWVDVIERRAREVRSGEATLLDGRESLARIRAELAHRRG